MSTGPVILSIPPICGLAGATPARRGRMGIAAQTRGGRAIVAAVARESREGVAMKTRHRPQPVASLSLRRRFAGAFAAKPGPFVGLVSFWAP